MANEFTRVCAKSAHAGYDVKQVTIPANATFFNISTRGAVKGVILTEDSKAGTAQCLVLFTAYNSIETLYSARVASTYSASMSGNDYVIDFGGTFSSEAHTFTATILY